MAFTDAEVLGLFIKAADDLLTSDFAREIQKGVSTSITIKNGEFVTVGENGPKPAYLRDCLLTIRMLCQNKDPISFGSMSKLVTRLNVTQKLKDDFQKSRDNFNAFLKSQPNVKVEGSGADTNGTIFFTFLYGTYAHNDEEYFRALQKWEKTGGYPDLHAQFQMIVAHFMKAAAIMAKSAAGMLKELT